HDWAIEGDFSEKNPSGTAGGALPGGTGWYRKHFSLNPGNDRIYIDFDGAYMNTSVYINGQYLGTRPYGYASFSYDITPYIKVSGDNVLAVKIDNSEQPNSRWYSGCGIYRNVWMRRLNPVHIPLWGQFVKASVASDSGNLEIATELSNLSSGDVRVQVYSVLTDPSGQMAGKSKPSIVTVKSGERKTVVNSDIRISNPELWSTESPKLYTLMTYVQEPGNGRMLDAYETVTGFRTLGFDAKKGFSLNGKPMKINGVCLHHDAGALGAVVNRRAIERQLEIMKEMGVNAIRCSHNPPAPELLDLCDSMGLMVMDEAFDMWRKKKTKCDYSRYFNEWHERDLTDIIRRDRNHPSIIMWSIGNEVLEQWTHADADTLSLEQANLLLNFGHSKDMLAIEEGEKSINSILTKKLVDMVKELDTSRPVTSGCNEPNPYNNLFRSNALDIIGYNYHEDWFKDVPKNFPGKPFIITESVSGLMTRGYYRMPSDSMYIWPHSPEKPFFDASFSCSSYDNCHVPWGTTHEGTMRYVEDNEFIMGQFVWTGFDYIGEPTPFGWPARSSYFGIVDLAGFPKDVYYMYQSRWRPDKNVLHLYPHWNWKEGDEIDLWAYYNNADEVELFVNGKSQGIRTPDKDRYHSSWRVTFEPGTVTAVSRKGGKEIARKEIRTASAPYGIRLTPDRAVIAADGKDLSYITAEIIDADGNPCPTADSEITFQVSGAGENAGVDNGSPISLERFKSDRRKAFNGKALLIVRNNGKAGEITIEASADGLVQAKHIIMTDK
ncbi:glycoside hydrolase family 2 TIM barrel-domain containing protein, partial [uncultured Duncaniella sp.]